MNDDDRLLMSDSLRGQVPELEEDVIRQYEDSFLIGALEINGEEIPIDVVVGAIIGLAIEDVVKFDIRLSLSKAYEFASKAAVGTYPQCQAFQINLGSQETRVPGPFLVRSPRITDIDHETRMCTLAVDLVKL